MEERAEKIPQRSEEAEELVHGKPAGLKRSFLLSTMSINRAIIKTLLQINVKEMTERTVALSSFWKKSKKNNRCLPRGKNASVFKSYYGSTDWGNVQAWKNEKL
ncbi:hypothetical protein [Alkalicoccus daliensis]|uniref:Uncharacterized protein n=1 Tax=Alkalicoccus daliensis TaxID=745820 RepID=A0A1H0FND5_9BACI|nr:hypothetical protein [Alkalicoccus daliensis]SDN96042.1 hypothetical protein SAMN04488053_10510 [Alkalicoccus daliensis]